MASIAVNAGFLRRAFGGSRSISSLMTPLCAVYRTPASDTVVAASGESVGKLAGGSIATRHFVFEFRSRNNQIQRRRLASSSGDQTPVSKEANDDGSPAPAAPGLPGSQTGGKKLAIVFTCNVCETRSAKQFTEHAYKNGVVIVQCPGCNSKHLIADNLSMFTGDDISTDRSKNEGWNIENAMAKLGQPVKSIGNDNVLELTLNDVVGAEAIQKAIKGSSQSIPTK